MPNTEDAWKALGQVNDWIKVADTKAGLVLSASGVLGGAVLHGLPPHEQWSQHAWKAGMLLTALALACASALTSLRVFAPRLKVGEPSSPLHFEHIARRYADPREFRQHAGPLFDEQERLREALTGQLWATSKVARRKFRHVAPAVWLLAASLFVAAAAGLVPA